MSAEKEITQAQAQAEYIAAAQAGMSSDSNYAYSGIDSLGVVLLAEFNRAESDRQETEQRWLKDLRQYKGIYDPDVAALIGKNRSKAFVRATRVKVKTVDARTSDLLFPSSSERNYTAEPSVNPSLDKDSKITIFNTLAQQLGRPPNRLEFEDGVKKAAKFAAERMARAIDDQLDESKYRVAARKVLHSGHLYGTGVLKAPLVERKTREKFVRNGKKWKLITETYVLPFVDAVPVWRFYPDMSATDLDNCRYVFERHVMSRQALAELALRKSFNGQKIREHIAANPKGFHIRRYFDTEIRGLGERIATAEKDDGQYEIIERWGWIDGESLSYAGVDVPPQRMHETFFSNAWMLPDGAIIKLVLQPLNGVTWPYHIYYCDKDETSIFGEGFASIMRDDQVMINAGTRMVLDHAAISSGPQFEANMKLLSETESADEMYPFKIWKRNGEEPGAPAMRVISLPNGLQHLMPIVEMFKANADDVTAIPRYMQGENATAGAAGTASGMSMLMSAASVVMKDLITNYDEVTRTFIESLYRWNMQFNPDDSIKGDFSIKARGTASLMAKELRAQQLDQFSQMVANPMDAPFIKRQELLQQRADAHDLSNVIKTEDEVKAEQAMNVNQQQEQLQQQMQQLQMQLQQAQVQKLLVDIEHVRADIKRVNAIAVKTNVDSAYAGMQAGGVATERPEIAPAGDAILQSSGWVDQTPAQGTQDAAAAIPPGQGDPVSVPGDAGADAQPAAGQQDNNPLTPPSANVGANVGEGVGEGVGEAVGEHTGMGKGMGMDTQGLTP